MLNDRLFFVDLEIPPVVRLFLHRASARQQFAVRVGRPSNASEGPYSHPSRRGRYCYPYSAIEK
ncbi:unnamed protein product, partial [Nesidiocoris tenuis]